VFSFDVTWSRSSWLKGDGPVPSSKILTQKPAGIVAAAARPWDLRVTEADRDIPRNAEPDMICHLGATIPGQRCHDTFGTLTNLPDECIHHGGATFVFHLNQHDKVGSPYHQRGDVTFGLCSAGHLPDGLIPRDIRSLSDRYRINNLPTGLLCWPFYPAA